MVRLRIKSKEKFAKNLSKRAPPFMVKARSLVRLSPGMACECVPGSSVAMFQKLNTSQTLRLPISPTASKLISEIAEGSPRPVETLTCADPMERICVCQVLQMKDCLQVFQEST